MIAPPSLDLLLKKDNILLKNTLKKLPKNAKFELYGEISVLNNRKDIILLLSSVKKQVESGNNVLHAFPSYREYTETEKIKAINANTEREVTKGVFKCKKCGSNKTTSFQAQTRSSDEPMTNFVRCVKCNHNWTE